MKRRHSSAKAVAWAIPVYGVLVILGLAEELLHHSWAVALLMLPVGGWLLGRRAAARSGWVLPSRRQRRDRNRAQLTELRAQIAELEDAAGRPLTAITASYRLIQRKYRGGDDRR